MKTCLFALTTLALLAAPLAGAEIPVFVVAGQSNATGAGTSYNTLSASLKVVQPNVLYSGPQESAVSWAALVPPTQFAQIESGDTQGFGPEITIGKTISDAWGGKLVGETKYTVNGTNLYSQWNPNTPGSLYYSMLARVNDALAKLPVQKPGNTGKVAGFFWMQGESDGIGGRTTAQYQADLTDLIAHVRADFNDPNLPFVFGRITTIWPNAAEIRQAEANVAATVHHTFMLDTDSLDRSGIHYTSQGTVDMGIGFGNGYLSVVPEPSATALLIAGALSLLGFSARRGWRSFS